MSTKKYIAIIDYGVGNVGSIKNALDYLGYKSVLTHKMEQIAGAHLVILPGVGAFEHGMNNLKQLNLISTLNTVIIEEKKPILGLCLGMQLFFSQSEENGCHTGLNWIQGNVVKIPHSSHYKVPHVGWSPIKLQQKQSRKFANLSSDASYYFDHSYYVDCNSSFITSMVDLGEMSVTASVESGNIFGVQFHPEKSGLSGLRLFKNLITKIEDSNAI